MEIDRKDTQDVHIRLGDDLSIYQIGALHQEVRPVLETARRIRLDLEKVSECDTSGLQWLIALSTWSKNQGVTLEIESVSEAVQQLVDLCQAHSLLGLQFLMPADHREARDA